jgi:hypothetical protein
MHVQLQLDELRGPQTLGSLQNYTQHGMRALPVLPTAKLQ